MKNIGVQKTIWSWVDSELLRIFLKNFVAPGIYERIWRIEDIDHLFRLQLCRMQEPCADIAKATDKKLQTS